jgi:hypothetical protein
LPHTPSKSRRSVSQTDSSIVFVGARRSSPPIRDVHAPAVPEAVLEADDPILPVRGAREDDAGCSGSSNELRSAGGRANLTNCQ